MTKMSSKIDAKIGIEKSRFRGRLVAISLGELGGRMGEGGGKPPPPGEGGPGGRTSGRKKNKLERTGRKLGGTEFG